MKYLLNILFIVTCLSSFGQTEVTAEVSSKEIGVNEQVNYILKIINPPQDGSKPKISYPKFEGFEILGPPSQFQSSNFSSGPNGSQFQMTFTITFRLRPKKTGSYTFEASSVSFGSKVYKTDEITVNVVKGASGSNYPDKPMFARINLSKSSAYIGEPVTAVYKIYSRFPFEDINSYEPGEIDGFQVKTTYDILKTQNAKIGSETVNGKRYQTIEIRRVILFPLETGEMELNPFKITGVAQVDFFRSYSDNLVSNSPKIKIKEIPDKPANYNGAVGKFQIEAEVKKEKIEAGEAFDLTMKISGKGNTHLLEHPNLDLPPDFEIYGDPEIIDKTEITSEGAKGSIEYRFLIRANTRGEYTLGPFILNYFNPSTSNFQTAKTDSFNLKVEGGVLSKSSNDDNKVNTPVKDEIESKEDIRFIMKDEAIIESSDHFLYGKSLFWSLLFAPLAISSLFIFLIRKKRNRSEEDIAKTNRKQASKMALKVLKNAKHSLQAGDKDKFYEELHLSMIAYLKNKLNLDITEMNKAKVQELFKAQGLSEDLGTSIFEILDQCQMARYAPIDQAANEELIAKAEQSINQIQKALK